MLFQEFKLHEIAGQFYSQAAESAVALEGKDSLLSMEPRHGYAATLTQLGLFFFFFFVVVIIFIVIIIFIIIIIIVIVIVILFFSSSFK